MIFINKGDATLTEAQLNKRTQAYIDRDWPEWKRERSIRVGDGLFDAYMRMVAIDTDENRANNLFNWELAQYRIATSRLSRYQLSVGRAEVIESIPTGEQVADDATGLMVDVMTDVVTQTAIEPLSATVESVTVDIDGNETIEQAPNPLIVQDDTERAQAQAVIDATPKAVIDYDSQTQL